MKKYRNIYVAATSQHVGKTTSTLGLASAYMKRGLNVGYCKPVGQKFLDLPNMRVDKDTLLFSDLIKFEIDPTLHSPVILGPGATTDYLDNPEAFPYEENITKASANLKEAHELVIYEGTGHPGVGSVTGLSNAKVASMLDAGVIMIAEGGIGSTVDMLHMCNAIFRERNVDIIGVIVNKVLPEKMDKVRNYVGKWLDQKGIPLLGVIPYDKTLAFPLVSTVAGAIKGTVLKYEENLSNKVQDILAGSLVDLKELKDFEDLLLVASIRMVDRAIKKVKSFSSLKNITKSPLCGIVITGDGYLTDEALEYIEKHKLPLIQTNFDTYGVTLKISRIEVKINRNTAWKVVRAIELIEENVDLDLILEKAELA